MGEKISILLLNPNTFWVLGFLLNYMREYITNGELEKLILAIWQTARIKQQGFFFINIEKFIYKLILDKIIVYMDYCK